MRPLIGCWRKCSPTWTRNWERSDRRNGWMASIVSLRIFVWPSMIISEITNTWRTLISSRSRASYNTNWPKVTSRVRKVTWDYVINVLVLTALLQKYVPPLQKKMVLKDQSQREQFAKRFVREADTLKNHMAKYPSYSNMASNKDSPFDVMPALSELITMKDVDSMLFLEVSGLIQKVSGYLRRSFGVTFEPPWGHGEDKCQESGHRNDARVGQFPKDTKEDHLLWHWQRSWRWLNPVPMIRSLSIYSRTE